MQQPVFSELENFCYAQNAGLALPAQQTTIIPCPKKMVGRVIGKNGETIKALQQFTGAQIQIDQRCDPTRVSIAGPPKSLQVATSMVQDIVAGTFKGFAMLRSFANQAAKAPDALSFITQPVPVYIEGYGFVPPSQFYDPSDATAPVFQQNLHGYSIDPVSVLRAISPSNTSGSGGHSASPQGMSTAKNSNLNALSMALAAQAQLMGQGSTAATDARAQSPGFHTSPFFQTLSNLQQQQYLKPPIGTTSQLLSMTARSLFPAEEASEALNSADKLPAPSLNSSLPSLSTSSATPSSQANGLTVWSQLEKLSPDGGAASGSPLLTPIHTPSRVSSPATKPSTGGSSALPAADSAILLAQLQKLSLLKETAASQAEVSASSFYSAGWPTSTPEPTPALPSGWISLKDPENRRFYHNCLTGQSQYQPPQAYAAATTTSFPPSTASTAAPFFTTHIGPLPPPALARVIYNSAAEAGSHLLPDLFQ